MKVLVLIALISKILSDEIINVSSYDYPLPEPEDSSQYSIAIVSTTDIHGFALKTEATHPGTDQKYSFGGLEFLKTQINAVKAEWGDRMLFLDGGDQYQGGLESKLTEGKIITDSLNDIKLQAAAIGNHEFDNGQEYLAKFLGAAQYQWLAANVENKNGETEKLTNTKVSKIYTLGKINVGVIGLSTTDVTTIASDKIEGIIFKDYAPAVVRESKKLQEQGADVIVIISHVGTFCPFTPDTFDNKLRYYTEKTNCEAPTQDINKMIKAIREIEIADGKIYLNAVIGGHTHVNSHHFIEGIPYIASTNAAKNFHVMYLRFNKVIKEGKTKYIFNKEKTVLEGPVPVCEKVFKSTLTCTAPKDDDSTTIGTLTKIYYHNKLVVPDPKILELVDSVAEKLKPYKVKISQTEFSLKRTRDSDSQLGNIFTDCLKNNIEKTDVGIYNNGGLRVDWLAGDISKFHVFNMFPFDNAIAAFKVKGKNLKRLMKVLQESEKGFYPISGIQVYIDEVKSTTGGKPSRTVTDVKINDAVIDDEKLYKIATNKFLADYGDDFANAKDFLDPVEREDFKTTDFEFFSSCIEKSYPKIFKTTGLETARLIVTKKSLEREFLK